MNDDTTTGAAAAAYKTLETGARRSARVGFDDDQGAPARFDLCTSEGHLGWAKAMGEGPSSTGLITG